MKILIIGNGGREHAIIDKLSQSSHQVELYVLPGNAGMQSLAHLVAIDQADDQAIINFVLVNKIDLVIIGNEACLATGLSDKLQAEGIKVLGPKQNAAQIESSKEFAKKLMFKYDITTAAYQRLASLEQALAYLNEVSIYPIVFKFDGLAQGKGVSIIYNKEEGLKYLNNVFTNKIFGQGTIIVEEFLDGDEFSLIALVNNDKVYPFQVARDFKAIYDGNQGPNTGGMGAICPYLNIEQNTYLQALTILKQVSKALVKEGCSFTGVLYGGFINTKDGVKVIEFNARFGDPETQVILNNLASDLLDNILDLLSGKEVLLSFKPQISVGVVLAAPGYPLAYSKNLKLTAYLKAPFKIYHMQTKLVDEYLSNGGRVLFMMNEASTTKLAFKPIYDYLNALDNHTLYYRQDLIDLVQD